MWWRWWTQSESICKRPCPLAQVHRAGWNDLSPCPSARGLFPEPTPTQTVARTPPHSSNLPLLLRCFEHRLERACTRDLPKLNEALATSTKLRDLASQVAVVRRRELQSKIDGKYRCAHWWRLQCQQLQRSLAQCFGLCERPRRNRHFTLHSKTGCPSSAYISSDLCLSHTKSVCNQISHFMGAICI